jgi:hypothetical protein
MSHVYVIAGTFEQAKQYVSKKRAEYVLSGDPPLLMPNYMIVSDVVHLKGISKPHGVFIGTWRDRVDIYDIIQTLAMAWNGEHQMLNRMTLQTPKPKRPTPLMPKKVIDDAAALLAKEIDAHVLKSIKGQWTMLPLKP